MTNFRNPKKSDFLMLQPKATNRPKRNKRYFLLILIIGCFLSLLLKPCKAYAADAPATWPNPPAYCLTPESITQGEYCDFAQLLDIQPMHSAPGKYALIMKDSYGIFYMPYAGRLLANSLANHIGELFLTQGDFNGDLKLIGWRLYSASAYQ